MSTVDRVWMETLEPRWMLSGAVSPAFTDPATYQDTFWVSVNGEGMLSAPMVEAMIGGGDAVFGGGEYFKVGFSIGLYYARMTDGAANDYKFDLLRSPSYRTKVLPPDVTSLDQLPALVRDNLPGWASLGQVPITLADLEWARYYNLPFTIQLQTVGSHGGDIADAAYDINCYFESMGKDQCMWDVSDVANSADNPANLEPSGATWGSFTFATPTMVDPDVAAEIGYDLRFKSYCKRNLQDGIRQLLEICELPRYQGLLVAFAIDPEIHYPAHGDNTAFGRPFVEDYHPAMIYAFGKHLHARYGDDTPLTDTNGDGVTFWSDYGAEFTASGGFGHSHATPPATWSDVDPPRYTTVQPNNGLWQAWMNFKATVIDGWIEDEIGWMVEAGVPGERIFTHQTTYCQFQNDRSNWADEQWLDDWSMMEISGGYSGISQYQATNVGEGNYLYQNLYRRDEGWGAPEYNPYVWVPGTKWFSQSKVRLHLRTAWDTRAHVLWAHSWGNQDYRTVDLSTVRWGEDTVTKGPAGWTPVNLATGRVGNHTTAQVTGDSYFLSPDNLNLNAAEHPFIVAYMHHVLNGAPSGEDHEEWAVRWITTTDTTWDSAKEVSLDAIRHAPWGHKDYVLNLADNPNWTGTIKQIRLYPMTDRNSSVWIKSVALARHTPFTLELQSLAVDKKDTPRPVTYTPVGIATPFHLTDNLDSMGTNFVVYGSNTDGDFGTAGNFYRTTVSCGGAAEAAIYAPATNRLSLTKTGKWRQIILPTPPAGEQLLMTFRIGIRDGSTSTDGVRFRVRIRDEQRELATLFDREYRWNAWSDVQVIDLTPFAGQAVDLYLETHGISRTAGDASAWAAPVIHVTGGPVQVQFGVSASGGDESVSPAGLPVSLTAPAEEVVTVDYAVTGGTATPGADYSLAAGTLTFQVGEISKSIPLIVVNDPGVEPDETVVVTLSNPAGAELGANATHTYTIRNDDYPAGQVVLVDFEDPAHLGQFVPMVRTPEAALTAGNGGTVLDLWQSNSIGSVKYAPDGHDYLLAAGIVSADIHLRYKDTLGSSQGLVVKEWTDSQGQHGGYVVTLQPKNGNVTLYVGASIYPGAGTENWDFYRGGTTGHSDRLATVLTGYGKVPGSIQSLGWWNVSAVMTLVDDDQVRIDVTVTDADDNTYQASWTDAMSAAVVDAGAVGVSLHGIYSIHGQYDNFTIVPERTNQAPSVYAGADQRIVLPASASLAGSVLDDGLPEVPGTPTVAWSVVSGPGNVTFADETSPATTATFSAVGTYVLRLMADDGEFPVSDEVQVEVTAIMGDATGDGVVGIADLVVLADHYGLAPAATWEQGDFTGDGIVGIADLSALADHYGNREPAGLAAPAGDSVQAAAPRESTPILRKTIAQGPLSQTITLPSCVAFPRPARDELRVEPAPSRRAGVARPGAPRRAELPEDLLVYLSVKILFFVSPSSAK